MDFMAMLEMDSMNKVKMVFMAHVKVKAEMNFKVNIKAKVEVHLWSPSLSQINFVANIKEEMDLMANVSQG